FGVFQRDAHGFKLVADAVSLLEVFCRPRRVPFLDPAGDLILRGRHWDNNSETRRRSSLRMMGRDYNIGRFLRKVLNEWNRPLDLSPLGGEAEEAEGGAESAP